MLGTLVHYSYSGTVMLELFSFKTMLLIFYLLFSFNAIGPSKISRSPYAELVPPFQITPH